MWLFLLQTAVKNKYSNKAKLRIDFLTVYSTNLLKDKQVTQNPVHIHIICLTLVQVHKDVC